MKKKTSLLRRFLFAGILISFLCIFTAGGGYLVLTRFPSVGAQGADLLRSLFGDQLVASLEGVDFQVQDQVHRFQYQRGEKPSAPWNIASVPTLSLTQPIEITPTAVMELPQPGVISSIPTETAATETAPTVTQSPLPSPTPDLAWSPAPLPALGDLPGEGEWSPYIVSASGKTIACRTFLQPDLERPYAIAAVVAFNLERARLHYVLGTQEPVSDVPFKRPGIIPEGDRQPGILLAVFNGGFKTRHGHFGVMMDGTVLIPPREGFGTLAFYQDGSLRIGAWGSDISASPDIVAWRQNGPLIIQNGQINPHTNDNSVQDWGSTVDGGGVVPTWRSAVGLSADGKTLYYLAGPSLTIPALAQALQAAGAANAIQLDINNYWVHFGTITFDGDQPKTNPLFKEMNDNPDRYLLSYTRDFFYVTAKNDR